MRHRYVAVLVAFVALVLGISASVNAAAASRPFYWLTNAYGPWQLNQQFVKDGVQSTWHSSWAIMNQGNKSTTCHEKLPRGAVPTFWFGDFWTFYNAVKDNEIAGKTATPNGCKFVYGAVVVDYENWGHTPSYEAKNWRKWVKNAWDEAQEYNRTHKNHLMVIQAMTHGVPGDSNKNCAGWNGYLKTCDAPKIEAEYADVVDIQAQQEETDPKVFSYEANTGAADAKTGNHKVRVVAGLRSSVQNSDGTCTQIPSATLIKAWSTLSANVDGSWLNANCCVLTFAPLLEKLYP